MGGSASLAPYNGVPPRSLTGLPDPRWPAGYWVGGIPLSFTILVPIVIAWRRISPFDIGVIWICLFFLTFVVVVMLVRFAIWGQWHELLHGIGYRIVTSSSPSYGTYTDDNLKHPGRFTNPYPGTWISAKAYWLPESMPLAFAFVLLAGLSWLVAVLPPNFVWPFAAVAVPMVLGLLVESTADLESLVWMIKEALVGHRWCYCSSGAKTYALRVLQVSDKGIVS